MLPVYECITDILREAQLTSAKHPKCIHNLKKLFDKTEFDLFIEAFTKSLNYILVEDNRITSIYLSRCMQFIASFCGEFEKKAQSLNESADESPFLSNLLEHTLKGLQAIDDTIRFRSCQLLYQILNALIGVQLSEDLCEEIQIYLLNSLRDRKMIVRCQAAMALCRMQDPTAADCPVIQAYIEAMNYDTSAKVRKICVENVALRSDVIPHILKKMRDGNVNVSLAAFMRAERRPKFFQIEERRILMTAAMEDREKLITTYVKQKLVPSWLEFYNYDYIKLLKSLRLDADIDDLEETNAIAEYVLKILFKERPHTELFSVIKIDNWKLPTIESLNWDTILYWRLFLNELAKYDEYETEIEDFTPELVPFCKFIQQYYNSFKEKEFDEYKFSEYQYIIWQMFHMTMNFDFGDPVGRDTLRSLISEILTNVTLNYEVVEKIVENLNCIMPDTTEQIRFICELVSSIRCPEQPQTQPVDESIDKFKLAQLTVKKNYLMEDLDTCVKERDFIRSSELQKEINEVEKSIASINESRKVQEVEAAVTTDVDVIVKYLNIVAALLSSPKITELNDMLKTLRDEVIQDLLAHEHVYVQYKALLCYSLCCIIDLETAKVGIHIFCALLDGYDKKELYSSDLVMCAMGSIIDLIMVFGTDLVANPKDDNQSESFEEEVVSVLTGGSTLTSVVQTLVNLLDDPNTKIQERAVIGLCNFIRAGRVNSPAVVSRLIIKWCQTGTDTPSKRLLQVISLNLNKFPLIRGTGDQLEKAMLPTLKYLIKASSRPEFEKVDVNHVAKILIELCKQYPQEQALQLHSNLAIEICNALIAKPIRRYNIVFAKILLLLTLPEDNDLHDKLLDLCDEIKDTVADRTILNCIVKFTSKLVLPRILEDNENEMCI